MTSSASSVAAGISSSADDIANTAKSAVYNLSDIDPKFKTLSSALEAENFADVLGDAGKGLTSSVTKTSDSVSDAISKFADDVKPPTTLKRNVGELGN